MVYREQWDYTTHLEKKQSKKDRKYKVTYGVFRLQAVKRTGSFYAIPYLPAICDCVNRKNMIR